MYTNKDKQYEQYANIVLLFALKITSF